MHYPSHTFSPLYDRRAVPHHIIYTFDVHLLDVQSTPNDDGKEDKDLFAVTYGLRYLLTSFRSGRGDTRFSTPPPHHVLVIS